MRTVRISPIPPRALPGSWAEAAATHPWRASLHANSFYLMAANVANAAFGFLFWTAAARLYVLRLG